MDAWCLRPTIIRILFLTTAMAIIAQSQSSSLAIGRGSGELRMLERMRANARAEHGEFYNGIYAAAKKTIPQDWMTNAQKNGESYTSPYVLDSRLALQYSRRLTSIPGEQEATRTANLRAEVEALIAFREGVTLDPLGALSSWNSSDNNACHWRGVTCASLSESVVGVELGDLELEGSITRLLGSLKNLQNLNLSNNLFSGEIPSSLANCSELSNLVLGGNNLTGQIPSELGDLLQLRSLDLSNNALLGGTFPPSLGNCSLLQLLLLNSTNLGGEIPSTVGRLAHLQIMDISLTALSGAIPKSLGNCSSLTQIYMGNYNDINKALLQGELPLELGGLVQLRGLGIDGTNIVGEIPGWIANLTRLNYISLSFNSLSGEIPDFVGQLQALTSLDFGENNFTGAVPVSITNCSKLTYLVLESNSLSGFMPPELGLLRELGTLSLSFNSFSGPIPSSIANCSALINLLLAENPSMDAQEFPPWIGSLVNLSLCYLTNMNLQGAIPADIGKLSQMQYLVAGANNLTGQIPATVGNCSSLVQLSLYENQLSGELPSGIWALSQMQKLFLFNNLFTGALPASIGNMSEIVSFEFGSNNLSGAIPQDVGSLQNLQNLDLDTNNFDGYIPTFLGNSSALRILCLSTNRLTGTIPPSLGNLTGLQTLCLDSNMLEGSIPAELSRCLELGDFYLSQNFLQGSIPEAIGQLSALQYLYLDNNNLSGIVPDSFSTCISLLIADLSYNAFSGALPTGLFADMSSSLISWNVSHNFLSGSLPTSVAKLLVVNYLDFSANNFSGPIPLGLGQCKSLISLDLSVNSFSGSIPQTLGQLPYLTYLNVSGNGLEGPIPSGGIFATGNVTAASFSGNAGLCGTLVGRACVYLAPSPSELPRSTSCKGFQCNSIRVSVACGAAALLSLLLGLFVLLCRFWVQKYGNTDGPVVTFQKGLKVSMEDIVEIMQGPENKIGVGASSTVYKGMLRGGKTVAIKALSIRVDDADHNHKQAEADLLREAQILSKLKHRNILKVLGFFSSGEVVALISEFMPEGSLNDHLYPSTDSGARKCELKWDTTLNIALGVAHGLVYLHSQLHEPVIHRDLKPGNVFLDAEMEPKLGDFGISRCVSSDKNGEKTTSTFCGTLGYIPPEYGATMRVSTKGDVYSYGVILLELLTRQHPILTENANEECRILVDWVLESFEENPLGILDGRLITESIDNENQREQMKLLMRVGLLCTRRDPQNRPHMNDVLAMVNQIKERGSDQVGHRSLAELAHEITISDTSSSHDETSGNSTSS